MMVLATMASLSSEFPTKIFIETINKLYTELGTQNGNNTSVTGFKRYRYWWCHLMEHIRKSMKKITRGKEENRALVTDYVQKISSAYN